MSCYYNTGVFSEGEHNFFGLDFDVIEGNCGLGSVIGCDKSYNNFIKKSIKHYNMFKNFA